MTKNILKTEKLLPISSFSDAFSKLPRFAGKKFDIEVIDENKAAKAVSGGHHYEVVTREWLFEEVIDMLTDIERAPYLNLQIWIKVTNDEINCSEFILDMAVKLKDVDEATIFNLALSISSNTSFRGAVFWKILQQLDNTGALLSQAIISAAKTFEISKLASKILELRLDNGLSEYNQLKDGIFEEVTLDVNELTERFYNIPAYNTFQGAQ